MAHDDTAQPDSTAARVALWRALHVQRDAAPPVFDDEIGMQLLAPEDGWQRRPDMDPASGNSAKVANNCLLRCADGKVVEQTGVWDSLSLMRQINADLS